MHLTRVAARSLAPEVRVNGIAPGTVLPPESMTDDEIRRLAERAPLKKNGSPEDVVRALRYLLQADFVTGETLVVDGGRLLRGCKVCSTPPGSSGIDSVAQARIRNLIRIGRY